MNVSGSIYYVYPLNVSININLRHSRAKTINFLFGFKPKPFCKLRKFKAA